MPILKNEIKAQPKKPKLQAQDEQKYIDKLRAKAEIISKKANSLWGKSILDIIGNLTKLTCIRKRNAGRTR
jgi:hypothetical protein